MCIHRSPPLTRYGALVLLNGRVACGRWVCPDTDTVIIGMTQRSPFTNAVPMAVKPWTYNAITDMTVS